MSLVKGAWTLASLWDTQGGGESFGILGGGG